MELPRDEYASPEAGRQAARGFGLRVAARALLGLVAATLLLYITGPLIGHSWNLVIPQERPDPDLVSLSEAVQMRTLTIFVVIWILTLGMCVGSFLNVVIYRSLRGRTLLGNSRCPRCRHSIRARHNIPVLGWLMLEGRCHDCHLPISPRYPLVEATVGLIFLSLAAVELITGGWSLPLAPRTPFTGIAGVFVLPRADLIRMVSLHIGLLTILLSWALIQWDRMRIPPAYRLMSLLIPLLLSPYFPDLYPILYTGASGLSSSTPSSTDGLATAALGGLVGSFAGWFLAACGIRWKSPHHDLGPRREFLREVESSLGLIGLVLGWQAISAISLLVALGLFIASRTPLARRWETSWLLVLFFVTWIYLLAWAPFVSALWFVGPESSWIGHAGLLLLACGLTYVGRPPAYLRAIQEDEATPADIASSDSRVHSQTPWARPRANNGPAPLDESPAPPNVGLESQEARERGETDYTEIANAASESCRGPDDTNRIQERGRLRG